MQRMMKQMTGGGKGKGKGGKGGRGGQIDPYELLRRMR
jgi:hypothetical protein